MRALLVTLSLTTTLALAAPAAAEHPADAAAAQALFERGRSAAQRSDWPAACAAFAESQHLDPGAGTLMNWATCEARQNQVASAWEHFNEAAALLPTTDDRATFVRAQIRSLARRLPRLTIHLAPTMPLGARVLRNGAELGAASIDLPLPVDPGAVQLLVVCPGHEPRSLLVQMREGEQLDVTLEPGAELTPQPQPARNTSPPPVAPRSLQRDLGLSLLAVGSLGIGLGVASSVVVAGRKSVADEHCPSHRCDEVGLRAAQSGEHWLVANTLAWSLGSATLLGGAALLLIKPSEHRDASVQPLSGGAAFVYAEHY
jgi:hypothetical protein